MPVPVHISVRKDRIMFGDARSYEGDESKAHTETDHHLIVNHKKTCIEIVGLDKDGFLHILEYPKIERKHRDSEELHEEVNVPKGLVFMTKTTAPRALRGVVAEYDYYKQPVTNSWYMVVKRGAKQLGVPLGNPADEKSYMGQFLRYVRPDKSFVMNDFRKIKPFSVEPYKLRGTIDTLEFDGYLAKDKDRSLERKATEYRRTSKPIPTLNDTLRIER